MLKHAESGTAGIPRRAFNNPRALESLASSNLSEQIQFGGITPSAEMRASDQFKRARREAIRDIAQGVSLDAEDDRVAKTYTSGTVRFQYGGESYSMKVEADVKYSRRGGDSNTQLSNPKYTIQKTQG